MTIREAVLLSAGFGTRMRPMTLGTPKPALPFLNRPVMHWALDRLVETGIERVLVNLHHLPDEVRETAAAYPSPVDFFFSYEPELLGTAGFLGPMKAHLRGEAFFVVNGDVLHDFSCDDLADDLAAHPRARATLAVAPWTPGYTGVSLTPGGTIRGFDGGAYMFTGVYAARRELIEHLETPGRRELVRDLIGPLLPSGAVRGLVEKGLWEDLGCPAGYLGASMRGLARMAEGGMAVPAGSRLENLSGCPVLIHETARVHPSTVFTGPTVLGEGTVIEGKTRVGSAVFMPDTRLEAGRCIERAILSPWGNAMIGRGASIPDAEP